METNLTQIQKLDNLLDNLRDFNRHQLGGLITELRLLKQTNYEVDEIKIALKKLEKDGFIHSLSTSDVYTISLEGSLFIGYEKTQILENERLTSIGQMAIATNKYNNRLLLATWCAGIAAALLLLWQVWIWFYPTHKDYREIFLPKKSIEKSK